MDEWDAVFWDVGGVLLNIPSVFDAQTAFVTRLAELAGRDPDQALETYRDVLREHFEGRENREYRTARAGREKAVRAVVGEQADRVDWRALYEEAQAANIELNPGAATTVQALNDAGLYLGIISDADADRPQGVVEHFGLDDCFDHITTSEEVGYTKPDPRMFETALDKAGVDPDRSLMIGDKYENDIMGAANAGIHPVGYGADRGPHTEYQIDSLTEVLAIVGLEPGSD